MHSLKVRQETSTLERSLWHKANILREYIDRFEQNSLKNNTLSEELKKWITWARDKADWFDPFICKVDKYLTDDDLKDT